MVCLIVQDFNPFNNWNRWKAEEEQLKEWSHHVEGTQLQRAADLCFCVPKTLATTTFRCGWGGRGQLLQRVQQRFSELWEYRIQFYRVAADVTTAQRKGECCAVATC